MANTSISSLSRGLTGSLAQGVGPTSSGNAQVRSTTAAASGSGAGGTAGKGAQAAQTASRQMVNVDGESLNPNARRGTYLNILV